MAVRTPVTLYALALVVRLGLFLAHPDPAYADASYYVDVARALHVGQGFSVDFIFGLVDVGGRLPAGHALPIPSNGFWMPLASIVQLPTLWLFGPTQLASGLPFALIGALAAPLTWQIASEAGCGQRVALAAAAAAAIPAGSAIFMSQPENFSLYQVLGTATLWLAARALKGHRRSFVLAGLLAGLATLSRNDALLLVAVLMAVLVWDRTRTRRSGGTAAPAIPWPHAALSLVLFLLVVLPWYVRQFAVFGSLSPGSSQWLFVTTYAESNSLASPASLQAFLGQGVGRLLDSRLLGLVAAVGMFALLISSFALAPFVVIGAWARRRSVDFGPFLLFAFGFFVLSSLVYAIYLPHGAFLHSAAALGPYTYILGLEGVASAVHWVAARRPTWHETQAARSFITGMVVILVLNAAVYGAMVDADWNADQNVRVAAARFLDDAGVPGSDRLYSADPASYKYFSGRGGIVTPDDPLPAVETIARDYDVRWLILERAHVVPSLVPVLESKSRPAWIGAPAFTVPSTGSDAGDGVANSVPALVIYPVCFSTLDARCQATRASTAAGLQSRKRAPLPLVSGSAQDDGDRLGARTPPGQA